ncbi:MAG: Ig-like domain-containing protein [Leptospiraceae bacterium]|nr:Ig-like domain-containing protein [Leptospiraceae bacterium]MCP5496087.1 Ig-like domain-containing protein [Leptospiraceae bacterium]
MSKILYILCQFLFIILLAIFCNTSKKKQKLKPEHYLLLANLQYNASKCDNNQRYTSYLTHGKDHYLKCGKVYYFNNGCSHNTEYSQDIIETRLINETCESLGFTENMLENVSSYYKCYYMPSTKTPSYYFKPLRCGTTIYKNVNNLGYNLDTDSVLPNVSSTNPIDETSPISKFDQVYISFSESMNIDTLISDNVSVDLSGSQVSVTVIKGEDYINIFPNPATNSWITTQTYTITISKNVEDYFGNQMGTGYTFKFEAQ